MKVLFDSQIFDLQRIGGISRYFSILASELPKEGVGVLTGLLTTKNVYMRERCPLNILRFLLRKKNKFYSRVLMQHAKYDVFHPTYYLTHVLRYKRSDVPMVVTVHDLIQEACKGEGRNEAYWQYMRDEKVKIVNAADRIIAISENTKRDIIKFWNIDEDRIDVVYHGSMWSPSLVPTPAFLPFSGGYLLFVGERTEKYKNFEEFIIAASQVVKRYGLHIVCTGKSFSTSEMELLKKHGVDQVTHSLFVNESTLLWLYQNAACFVFPSYYEGFGIPILEAFQAECPTILANASCFPEIGGDAVEYYEPGNADALLEKFTKLLDDSDYCNKLRALGRERLSQFSIEKMVTGTKECYQRALGK